MILRMILMSFISLSLNSFAFAGDDTAKNYKKYKSYSAPKKERLNDKWSKFKEKTNWDSLSDKERSKLKKKVFDKSK